MRAHLPSRALLSMFLAVPFVAACSSAAPPEPQSPPTVDVAPVQSGAAPGAGVAVAGDTNGAAQTVMPPGNGPTPKPAPTPSPTGAGGPDLDADGIADVTDQCPDEPEDRDGFQDADGCPDIDNDKDGIADMNDMCPNQPETKNGRKDEDGCPD